MLRCFRTPLAWLILTEHRGRFLLAVSRVAFAVLLMFSQLGFLNGVFDSQTHLIGFLNADLFVVNRSRPSLVIRERFSRRRLYQAKHVPGVAAVFPLYILETPGWKRPYDGTENPIRVLAFDPRDPVFRLPEVERCRAELALPDTALVDSRCRSVVGRVFPGAVTELNQRKVRILDVVELGADFAYDGNLITSDINYFRYFPDTDPGQVDVGLVQLEPGADAERTAAEIRQRLPDDVDVLTRADFRGRERLYWAGQTATGAVFGLGLVIGLVVGILTCYQILFSDVTDNLPQLATLKAIGYPNRFLIHFVLQEALLVALVGFLPGVLASHVLYVVIRGMTNVQMFLTPGRIAFIAVLTVLMCQGAGLIAVRKALKTDPAELFG